MATIIDVAREAGVSTSTVSRALNKPDMVNAVTREQVLEVSRKLSYSANRAARELITGRRHAIGVVVPDISNPFFPALIKAAGARARAAGYAAFLADTDEDGLTEYRVVEQLSARVEGLVICSSR